MESDARTSSAKQHFPTDVRGIWEFQGRAPSIDRKYQDTLNRTPPPPKEKEGRHDKKEPRGSIYTAIMELGPQNHNGDGLLGANSIIVVYMDPLGMPSVALKARPRSSRPEP